MDITAGTSQADVWLASPEDYCTIGGKSVAGEHYTPHIVVIHVQQHQVNTK